MELSFIIPNYQSQAYLEKCLFSLVKNLSNINYEIIIINNDPTPLLLTQPHPQTTIIQAPANLGFAKACNLGARQAKGKILFFLNPDTELLSNDLSNFLPLLEQKNVGILAPQLLTTEGLPQPYSSGKKITPLRTLLQNIFKQKPFFSIEPQWVSGAAFLIKKNLFEKLGGFDENFFMYFEDVDFCLRLGKFGKKITPLPKFCVLHHGGQSSENSASQKKQYYASQDYYFQKHFGFFQAFLIKIFRKLYFNFQKLSFKNLRSILFGGLLFLCTFLPFQFALNPAPTIDLAIIRVLILLIFFFCLFDIYKNFSLFKNRLSFLLLLFLGLALFSVLFSQNLAWSLRKLAFLFSFFPLYFITILLTNSYQKKRQLLSALVAGGALVSLFALSFFYAQFFFSIEAIYTFLAKNITPFFLGKTFSAQVLAYPSWLVNSDGTTYLRAFAPFPDPHMLSYFTGMLLPWSVALWASSLKKTAKLFFGFAIFLLALCNIATFTRGGYLALIASALFLLPLAPKKTAWKIAGGLCLFAFLFFAIPKNPITTPITSRTTSSFNLQEGSNQGRLAIWQQGIKVLLDNPQGVGIGNYPLKVAPATTYRTPIYTHNLYLDIAVELGIITTLVFIFILSFALKNFWQLAQKNSFYLAGIASLLIFSFHSFVENPLYSVHILPLFLIILAISTPTSNEEF